MGVAIILVVLPAERCLVHWTFAVFLFEHVPNTCLAPVGSQEGLSVNFKQFHSVFHFIHHLASGLEEDVGQLLVPVELLVLVKQFPKWCHDL